MASPTVPLTKAFAKLRPHASTSLVSAISPSGFVFMESASRLFMTRWTRWVALLDMMMVVVVDGWMFDGWWWWCMDGWVVVVTV
jgi:hypothetical protein